MRAIVDFTADWTGAACFRSDPDGVNQVDARLFDVGPLISRRARHREASARYCHHCPIRPKCLLYGIEHKLSGTYGGLFLEAGRSIKPAAHPGRPSPEEEPAPA